jgi:hypothetical protein
MAQTAPVNRHGDMPAIEVIRDHLAEVTTDGRLGSGAGLLPPARVAIRDLALAGFRHGRSRRPGVRASWRGRRGRQVRCGR